MEIEFKRMKLRSINKKISRKPMKPCIRKKNKHASKFTIKLKALEVQ